MRPRRSLPIALKDPSCNVTPVTVRNVRTWHAVDDADLFVLRPGVSALERTPRVSGVPLERHV